MPPSFPLPEITTTDDGATRRVGVEIELSGITPDAISRCVVDAFGGQVEEISPYELCVADTEFGDFIVELDFSYLKELAKAQKADEDTADIEHLATELLGEIAGNVVPHELVSPPLPVTELYRLEPVVDALRAAGAKGTRDALHFAFGVHFNPEMPALDAATVVAYFKAYLCLHDWLSDQGDTDWARLVTPHIRPFPKDYCKTVLAHDYWPTLAVFIEDYLRANPTRNRALDMLPLLAWFDEAAVQRVVRDDRVKKRPTLHYRLPNSDISSDRWNLRDAWGDWLQVESLANDRPRLDAVCQRYVTHLDTPVPDWIHPWKNQVTSWLKDH